MLMPPPVVVHGLVAQLEENGGLPEAPNFPPPPPADRSAAHALAMGKGRREDGGLWLSAMRRPMAASCGPSVDRLVWLH